MPRYTPVNILGGCYSDSDRAWSLQDTVNWLPEQAEQSETRTPTQFKTPPGLRPYVQVSGPNASKPVRGTYNCENKLFAAIGKGLYQITNNGIAIEQGTIPGNTRVTMTHNQISQGNQLVAVNGSSGYVFNTLTQVYEKIVDEGFPGAIWVGFADGYILGVEPGRRFAFNSEPADALNYNTLDRFTSEYKPDLIVTGIVNNNELILLNETSYEFFENTGATQQPFRSKRIYGDVGCASRFGAANLDRTVFMFGADGKFYRLEGYNWIRISTRPIEQAIRGLNWSQCFTTVWEDAGHSVVRWTFPDGMTWCFDQSTQLWHRMKSLGLDRYRINTSTQLGQNWYCGDFQTGRIWVMDWDYILEGDDPIESERVTGVLSDNQNLLQVNRVELLFNTGQELTVPVDFPAQPDGPDVTGSYPDGVVGVANSAFPYVASSGTPPYYFSIRPGNSPAPGIGSMSSSGIVPAGTPTTLGSYQHSLRVTDQNGLFKDYIDPYIVNSMVLALGSPVSPGGTFGILQVPDPTNWAVTRIPTPAYYGHLMQIGGSRVLLWGPTDSSYSDDFGTTLSTPLAWLGGDSSQRGGCYVQGTILIAGSASDLNVYRSTDEGVSGAAVSVGVATDNCVTHGDRAVFTANTITLPGSRFRYTDDALATPLVSGSTTGITSTNCLASFGDYVVMGGVKHSSGYPGIAVTDDCINVTTYEINTDTGHRVDAACGATISGEDIWVFGLSNGKLYWSVIDETGNFGAFTAWVQTMPAEVYAITFDGSNFLVGGNDSTYVLTSPDGKVGTQRPCTLDDSVTNIVVVR